MRINVGSGAYLLDGFVNVDAFAEQADIKAVVPPLPFPDESASEVAAIHFLEHLNRADTDEFLRECMRVLRPGGTLGVVVPDTREIMRRYLEGGPDVVQAPLAKFWRIRDLDDVCALFLYSTYQDTPHWWSYDADTLRRTLERAGFVVTSEIDRYDDPRITTGGWYQVGYDCIKPEPKEATHD